MSSVPPFVWEESLFQVKSLDTPVAGVVAHVPLFNKDFKSACSKAFPEVAAFLGRVPLDAVNRNTSMVCCPTDPHNSTGADQVYIHVGFALNADASVEEVKSALDAADLDTNPLADPDDATRGRKYRVFESSSGLYAVYRVLGSYQYMPQAYETTFKKMATFGYEPYWDGRASFDLYHNAATTAKEEDQISDIHIPVRKLGASSKSE